ncbi:MAG: hypothetical protein E6772_17970 [Dysgonomonas sp.]|nr:hypothetical protein [Dysgonomonas sp.]
MDKCIIVDCCNFRKKSLELNGVYLDEKLFKVLKRWQNPGTGIDTTDPERYLNYLNEIQDCLIRTMMYDPDQKELISELLEKLILIKDDIKSFVR